MTVSIRSLTKRVVRWVATVNKRRMYAFTMFLCFLSGCASPVEKTEVLAPNPTDVDLLIANSSVAHLPPLNLSISVFREGNEITSPTHRSKARVRSAEQKYLPYSLKETLDRSGFWGAVRVMPKPDLIAEVNITGEILFSNGNELGLRVRAVDSTGKIWLDRTYHDFAGALDYLVDPDYRIDPFQDLYDSISNDLAEKLKVKTKLERDLLVNIAILKYAKELSHETFGRFVAEDSGFFVLKGLPAESDPLFKRVKRLRYSEYLFADSVDEHYRSLYRKIGPTYAWWRHYSHELIGGNRKLGTVDAKRGATKGTWYAMERVYKTYKESKMNEDALRELTESFDRETEPTVADISGSIVRLTGTLERQYEDWRRLLQEFYREEVGY